MTGTPAIPPEQTHALVVGIEAYPRRPGLDLQGPAADALKFARWLRGRGLPPENLKLLLSSRLEPAAGQGLDGVDLFHGMVSLEVLENALASFRRTRSRLLVLFWTGHGIMTADHVRRPLLANYSDSDPHNLNVESLQEHLRSATYSYPAQQVMLFDMCATLFDERLRRESLIDHKFQTGPARLDCQQFLLYAAADRQAAENLVSEKTGLYFKELMPVLDQEPGWPPEMRRVVTRLEERFAELRRQRLTSQEPIYQFWRAPTGQGESKYLGPHTSTRSASLRRALPWKQALTAGLCLLPALLLSDLALGLAPPWPDRWVVAFSTLPVSFLVYLGVRHGCASKPRPWLERFLRWDLGAGALMLLAYLCLFVLFTHPLPDHWHRDIGGFTYTQKAAWYRQQNPGIPDTKLIEDMGNDVESVFGPTSLGTMRILFLVLWLFLFACGSALAAVSLLLLDPARWMASRG